MHTPSEFAAVLRRRGLIRGVCLELLAADNGRGIARLGLIVPKRLMRRAVHRNMIKRQIRESFRVLALALPAKDYVVRLVRPLVSGSEPLAPQVRADADQLFLKAGVK